MCLSGSICGFIFLFFTDFQARKVSAEDAQDRLEKAMFTRQKFFGTEAIVPLPTAERRENLIRLAESSPTDAQILEKLADANEKLMFYGEAENNLLRLAEIDASNLEKLAAFYERRGRFEKQAEILRTILFSTAEENRVAAFERLMATARKHDLRTFLQPEFYAAVAEANPHLYRIFEKLIDNLRDEKNYAEALRFARQARAAFPARKNVLLEKEIEILLENDQAEEAEVVYTTAFDPFWSETEARKFYDFLNRQNRLRAYGAEIKARFLENPADFDAGIRLALYRNHDYEYGNDAMKPVILKLEQAKKSWTTDELVIATRLLIRSNEAETASRFLYTLYAREDFRPNSELRARVLYQLFEMFSDAENQKLPVAKGDLRFYEDVARADTNPGITTGILSLIFSDMNPSDRLDAQESRAMKYYNRAAAYRIFEEYKKENSNSPELAQMYLDITKLYAATGETEIAEKTLNEFAEKYENAHDYADAALKLADAFAATGKPEKTREIYQKALDYLGNNQKSKRKSPKYSIEFAVSGDDDSGDEISAEDLPQNRNDGIKIPKRSEKPKNYYYDDYETIEFRDYLERKNVEITYEEVLEKLVASLAVEKNTTEILRVYSGEIEKYPDEEWLYEQRLTWLEQTNLATEQLQFYKKALERFPTGGWRDRLARFFVRHERDEEFVDFSEDLIGKLGDADAQSYLSRFVDAKISASEFDRQIYLKLYRSAHRRFPHNLTFVNGLLRFYQANSQPAEWQKLATEYYFASSEVRERFLDRLSETGELRSYLAKAVGETTIYELFRADASVRLSDYENAVAAYRKLNRIYPNEPEFAERLISLTRSFGRKNRELLTEAAALAESSADFQSSSAELRVRGGEIFAELGDYEKAGKEWSKLTATARGQREIYLEAATVYWDYFQYDDALRTIESLRDKFKDETLYAFESGAILEAQHKETEAIAEYVKALEPNEDAERQKEKAGKRLKFLSRKEESAANNSEFSGAKIDGKIERAFANEKNRRKDASFLSLGYAEFLADTKRIEKAERILNAAIRQSRNLDFLEAARDFYQSKTLAAGEQIALKRLAEVAKSPRQKIQSALQLAESFEEARDRNAAKNVLNELAGKFPTNYGVLIETSDFYKRLGYEDESAQILQNGLSRARGDYRVKIAEKLAARLINFIRLGDAERILAALHKENPVNQSVLRELAKVCVRTGNADLMRKAFAETVAELKKSVEDRREIDWQIAGLRTEMIDAFTQLGDYESALAQHIEIVNREPEDEKSTENAIRYVQRYGGAEMLLEYYLKLSAEAFKNYRWNVVLARIYRASGDTENAVRNYETAIVNQPEMPELYLAIAEIEAERNNADAAVKNLDEVLILTNDAPEYVKKKIEVLRKAGRFAEAEKEKSKLPFEAEQKAATEDFDEARNLQSVDEEKARQIYRQSFEKLLENPLETELQTGDLIAYANFARRDEPLDSVNEKLWRLRDELIEIADKADSLTAKEARKRLTMTDGAIVGAIGHIAGNYAMDEELNALHADLQKRIDGVSFAADANQTLATIQDVVRRARFGNLEETILRKRIDETASALDREIHVRNLVNFYTDCGAYQKTFDALEKYGGDSSLKAETARLIGNREKELTALREIYWRPADKYAVTNDANVARFLEILDAENRAELQSLTEKPSARQLQLINFLLGKGKRELAHSAIENSHFSTAWKASRHAETSLALKEFDEKSECYFCAALQFASIGEMIEQTPDKKHFLINDDWFRLTRQYGEWVFEKNESQPNQTENGFDEADEYLAAMTENQLRNAGEQSKLGAFYLKKNRLKAAVEHFRVAAELEPDDRKIQASLGAAYFKIGKTADAEQSWAKATSDETIESGAIYFQTLRKYDLTEKAREKLSPIFVKFLESNDAENSADFQSLVRAVAASFADEREKAAWFLNILRARPTDVSLAAMLAGENLIGDGERTAFYELLIERSDEGDDADYAFQSIVRRVWTSADAESVYDQENEYEIEEPTNAKYEWRVKYLDFLINRRETARAARLIAEIEKQLSGKFSRPARLRLAEIRLETLGSEFDLPQAESFVGIKASDAATQIIAPSVERFNEVLEILRAENRGDEAMLLSESYFARSLALGRFDAANFTGLARTFFQKGETEKALELLRLMIDAADENRRETAQAEIAAIKVVKAKAADAAKTPPISNNLIARSNALALAAEIAAEFGQTEKAIDFRRELLLVELNDSNNKIKLAELLRRANQKDEAARILRDIIADRNALRGERWNARNILFEAGEDVDFPNVRFDSFSQFYHGTRLEKSNPGESADFFIDSLIADRAANFSARPKLVEVYAAANKPFAALKLAESIKETKSDELLVTLSETAEKIGDYAKAIEFEKAKTAADVGRIVFLQKLADEKNRRATDFSVDAENTRKL